MQLFVRGLSATAELLVGTRGSSAYRTICWKGIRLSPKLRVLTSKTFTQIMDLENLATARRSFQVMSTWWTISVMNW